EWLHVQLDRFLSANPGYRGICLDFEQVPVKDNKLYTEWIAELYQDLHAKNLRLYINVEIGNKDWFLKALAANTDGVILMNYDQHEDSSGPGPIAAEDWFDRNLQKMLKAIPREKIIC